MYIVANAEKGVSVWRNRGLDIGVSVTRTQQQIGEKLSGCEQIKFLWSMIELAEHVRSPTLSPLRPSRRPRVGHERCK